MNNFTLNLYKAFGLKKAKETEPSDPFDLIQRLMEEKTVPDSVAKPKKAKAGDEELYITRTGGRGGTKKHRNARLAIRHAIKQMMEKELPGVYISHPIEFGDSGAITKLYRHPETGNLILGHGSHENYTGADMEGWNANTPQRDIQALDKMKRLQKFAAVSTLNPKGVHLDIDTSALTNLPEELHTTTRRVHPWSEGYFDPNWPKPDE